jgi:SAM-dependent methyltransferase
MHPSSHNEMRKNLSIYSAECGSDPVTVVDIGSLDCNGTYKDLLPPHWKYIGVDLRPGPNVDICMENDFEIPLESGSVDLVISGQCLEHCRNPFRLVAEAVRILKPNGLILLVAPFIFFEHKEPRDCFRFLPDGMEAIFEECGIDMIRAYLNPPTGNAGIDCWAIGRKPCA